MPQSSSVPEDSNIGEIYRQYREVRDALLATSPDDFEHQLPNLVEEIATISQTTDDTLRFRIGVSFSQNQTLLDYQLSRVVEEENRVRVEEIKAPVSQQHRYLQFIYPPDPEVEPNALRGAVLAMLEQELRGLTQAQTQAHSKESIADLWRLLSDK